MKEKLSEMVTMYSEKLTAAGFALTILPSKLPDSQFIYARKEGAKPMITLASVLDANKHVKKIAKEIEDHQKSVRIYADNPAGSSIHGSPLSVLLQDLQDGSEAWVNKQGDSFNFLAVVTKKGFRLLKPNKKQTGGKPFDYVGQVGHKHNADLVIVGWGGWERAVEPPSERTGREIVATTVISPDGTVFATLQRRYSRDGKNIVWDDKENIAWSGSELKLSINPNFNTAWRTIRAKAA